MKIVLCDPIPVLGSKVKEYIIIVVVLVLTTNNKLLLIVLHVLIVLHATSH